MVVVVVAVTVEGRSEGWWQFIGWDRLGTAAHIRRAEMKGANSFVR